ncbi:MAG: hypothetical protein D6753_12225 [Planctomycetota bacterium]|nr:MAG: hypothetical protein D6753_12225 [Planctomycetota bacterium]
METVYRDYAPRGVRFYYVYKALAHPGTNGYVTPYNLQERLQHIAEAKRTLGTQIPWLCDSMDNALKHALGDRPNSEFVVDPRGRIVVARAWSDPAELRKDLERLVGPVDRPTRVADLHMPQPPAAERPPRGIVPPLELPGRSVPLRVQPGQDSEQPYYVKLRAELVQDQQLYLGFYLDPLYLVHWNNEAPALQYEIVSPAGVRVSPDHGTGPSVEAKADVDPREFLHRLEGRATEPLRVTLRYFACDDAATFCKPMTQTFEVFLQTDPDGGQRRVPRRSASGGRGVPSGGPQSARRPSGLSREADRAAQMLQRFPLFQVLDRDKDGLISSEELDGAPAAIRRLDRNRNGRVEPSELRPRPLR